MARRRRHHYHYINGDPNESLAILIVVAVSMLACNFLLSLLFPQLSKRAVKGISAVMTLLITAVFTIFMIQEKENGA